MDPLLCNPEVGDFGLDVQSPCSAANSPCGEQMGAWNVGCGIFGACCLPNGVCVLTSEVGCLDVPGAEFLGEGTACDPIPCPPAYACCFEDGYCDPLVETVCTDRGGFSLGEGSSCSPLPCGTITVYPDGSGNFTSIQHAISNASSGAVIELADGVFSGLGNRDIDFEGKSILLRSQSGDPEVCVVDCEHAGRGLLFVTEQESGVVSGITIRNGSTAGDGAGIYCVNGSTPILQDCILEGNVAVGVGGAVFVEVSGPTLVQCVLRGNSASRGGAMLARNAFPGLDHCTVTGNGSGGAIACEYSAMSIVSSTVAGNRSTTFGGGLRITGAPGSPSWITFDRSIVWRNCANAGAQVFLDDQYSGISFICSAIDISGVGGLGTVEYIGEQVEEDPLFCGAIACAQAPTVSGDYTLMADSPCLPESSPCGDLIGSRGSGCAASHVPIEQTVERFHLGLPSPNPSTGTVALSFSLPKAGSVRIRLLDVGGRSLETLQNDHMPAGHHQFLWDARAGSGRPVSNGIYYLEVSAEQATATRRLAIIR